MPRTKTCYLNKFWLSSPYDTPLNNTCTAPSYESDETHLQFSDDGVQVVELPCRDTEDFFHNCKVSHKRGDVRYQSDFLTRITLNAMQPCPTIAAGTGAGTHLACPWSGRTAPAGQALRSSPEVLPL